MGLALRDAWKAGKGVVELSGQLCISGVAGLLGAMYNHYEKYPLSYIKIWNRKDFEIAVFALAGVDQGN